MKKGFYKRFRDSELLMYNVYSRISKGPLIICIDTSHSMEGDSELLAKALALAFRDISVKQERTFKAVLFGARNQPVKVIPFEKICEDNLIEMAEFYYGGGTDFEMPLRTALTILNNEPGVKGDIIFLSDGQCELSPSFKAQFISEKRRLDIKVISIIMNLGKNTDITLQAPLSDSVYYASDFIKS